MGHQDAFASRPARLGMQRVLQRLRRSGELSCASTSRVEALGDRVESAAARSVLQDENAPVRRPRYLLSGWACRYRHLPDGRRQIFDLILPGEGLGICLRPHPFAKTSIQALTPVAMADAAPLLEPEALAGAPDLRRAIEAQADLGEQRMLDQIMRLGRLSALERLAHLFADLHARLEVVGLAEPDRFELPLTQEVLADMAGLSVVHVNRTLTELRRQELADFGKGVVRLPDLRGLWQIANYERVAA